MFIEVILPLPLSDTYTYSVPEEMEKKIVSGCMVLVEFGKNKRYTGVVAYIRQIPPNSDFMIRPILSIESDRPVLHRPQLRFWEWLAQYYLCKLGEVYKAVLPSGFRTESTSGYRKKTETFIRLAPAFQLQTAFDAVRRSKQQEGLLLAYVDYSHAFSPGSQKEVSRKELLLRSELPASALTALLKKGILEQYDKEVSRLQTWHKDLLPMNSLSDLQQEAYAGILQSFRMKDVCLLHGVTASGKTEIYIHLINEALKLNRQALFLLPEIALTAQITQRLRQYFGDKLGVYHSKVKDNERVEIWNNLLNDEGYRVILGVRSSIFLPFRDLGLVIVDEEHEPGYKQQDPAPRYNARNAAIVLATMHAAKVVLGSATPSLESYYNAQIGKYAYVRLDKRFEGTELPAIFPVDIKELRRKKKMKGLFSPLLTEKMKEVLERGEQILLFQNRRGFAPMLHCRICDWTPKCRSCDLSLTFHKRSNQLSCHYCGAVYRIPTECPDCGNTELQAWGFGTEKVEEELQAVFPGVSVDRMDADTTRNKKSSEEIIARFEQGETQVLIGTQMITKGLDFDKVSLVGILNADTLMNFPDFRAYERAYQLMSQVAGRAGRRKQQGEVVLQTSHPDHPLIQMVMEHNYEGMYRLQMEERQMFRYPPFYRLVQVTLKHKNEDVLREQAALYADQLRQHLGERVMGPDKPTVGRVQAVYLRKILIKIEVSAPLATLRKILEEARPKQVVVQYDVDPV